MDRPSGIGILLKGTAMQIVVGPILTREGGYAFDCWTPEQGLSPGYTYGRVEDAHYARNVEIRGFAARRPAARLAALTTYAAPDAEANSKICDFP